MRFFWTFAAVLLLALGTGAPARAQDEQGMPAFASEAELKAFLTRLAHDERVTITPHVAPAPPPPPPPPGAPKNLPPPPPPPAKVAPSAAMANPALADNRVEESVVTGARSITNNQIDGVDEGDIVKLHGDDLIVLRRGRLFSVSIAGGRLKTRSFIDAYPPGVDGREDWYDEMLVSGDRIVVIGYSYAREGTLVNRFRIDAAGRLSFEDAYQFRSDDYYSDRNYASRLIGSQLILYSPLPLNLYDDHVDPMQALPGMHRYQPGERETRFTRTVDARHVYIPAPLRADPRGVDTLHSVTRCDLAAAELSCDSTVVIGAESRTFFVSENAVYVWVDNGWDGAPARSQAMLYRMPLDGARPQAVGVAGFPVDQFSFKPDAARKALQVVVRAEGGGDGMWRPEVTDGDVALLSLPMAAFGDGARTAPKSAYQPLPSPGHDGWNFTDRFVGDYLLYGLGAEAPVGAVIAVSLKDHRVTALAVDHGVERIDAVGPDAIVIGSGDKALGFSVVDLGKDGPGVTERFRLPDAAQGENRSHAFFFHPDAAAHDGSGLIGLPVMREGGTGTRFLGSSAAIVFLARRGGHLSQAGELAASGPAGKDGDDDCRASCVDWYGNARPIFVGDRILALMGYELVEAHEAGGKVVERGRTDFSPGKAHTPPPPPQQP